MFKYLYILVIALSCVSCKKPVLSGGYESSEVQVEFSHVPSLSSGAGNIDTDEGISERELSFQSDNYGETKQYFTVKNVTSAGFDLDYDISIENPRGSSPKPYSGSVKVPYSKKVTSPVSDDYNLTISVTKPRP